MVEVVVVGVVPCETQVALALTEHTFRSQVAHLQGCGGIVCGKHGHLTQVHGEVAYLGTSLQVERNHVDGLAVERAQIVVSNGPSVLGGHRRLRECHVWCSAARRGELGLYR